MRTIHKTRFGPMLINELDQYVGRSLMVYGDFSRGEAQLFSDLVRPGMVVCDVGANIGAHTLQFAQLVGPQGSVHAFEPQRLVFQMLCANMAINQLDNVFCHQEGVGAKISVANLATADPAQPTNFGGLSLEALSRLGGEPVSIRPLDVPCHFLKIDVEGMELEVLEGARGMILACRPFIYVENDRIEKSEALIQAIENLGYLPYWHITPLFEPDNFNGVTDNVLGNCVSINMICFPVEATNIEHSFDRARGDYQRYLRGET